MVQLHQILALEKGTRVRAAGEFRTAQFQVNRPELLSGITRTYQPKDEEGEQLPPESKLVQVRTAEVLKDIEASFTRLLDITLTKDATNITATASIVVGTAVIAENVPVTFLLVLEKQLGELLSFFKSLPVLDPGERWTYDGGIDAWTTEGVQSARSKKIPRNHVKAEATERHPAQVEVYYEDVAVGHWTTVKHSGALSQSVLRELVERTTDLLNGVKAAREQANTATVIDRRIGAALFGYMLLGSRS